jgi:uncharacterized protein with HEPN domain
MKQPSRTYQDSLRDMLEAATLAIRFVKGLHLNQFEANVEKQFAVVRALEIIGEAARQIPVDVHACYPDIPWSDMIGMRNLVIHAYFGVDLEVIWRTVQEDLPVLRIALLQILDDSS